MKHILKKALLAFLCLQLICIPILGRELIAVGQVVGLELQDGTVTIAAIDETLGAAARQAGLQPGDQLIKLNGRMIHTAEDVRDALNTSKGKVSVIFLREGKEYACNLQPKITQDGPKLGLYLRQGITGIGTVTWYDPETGQFGSLGHSVSNPSGQILKLTQGSAFSSKIVAVRKGKSGEPGQLIGYAEARTPIGILQKNLPQGVFGTSESGWEGRSVEVAQWSDLKTGKATILSTISGNSVQEYSVEIVKIYPNANESGRNLLIKVTDPALLEITGGIVQGMSGSPIIQDGKLVGAVTHVLVNDPTTGYGIFIENMLNAAA